MSMPTPTLALSDSFLKAYDRLPSPQKKKVRSFIEKFQTTPTAHAIDYEKLNDMADDRVRTVRIDQAWRAIIVHPDKGNVHLLVWVAHHDDAHDWARNRRFDIHPETGQIQIYRVLSDEPRPGEA